MTVPVVIDERRGLVIAKLLPSWRKAREFVVYPRSTQAESETIMVQADTAIGRFDPVTGNGVLNWRGGNAKYGPHLAAELGAEPFTFPVEFVDACLRVQRGPGQRLKPGLVAGGEPPSDVCLVGKDGERLA